MYLRRVGMRKDPTVLCSGNAGTLVKLCWPRESSLGSGSAQVDDEGVCKVQKDLPLALDMLQLLGFQHQPFRQHLYGVWTPALLVLHQTHSSKAARACEDNSGGQLCPTVRCTVFRACDTRRGRGCRDLGRSPRTALISKSFKLQFLNSSFFLSSSARNWAAKTITTQQRDRVLMHSRNQSC